MKNYAQNRLFLTVILSVSSLLFIIVMAMSLYNKIVANTKFYGQELSINLMRQAEDIIKQHELALQMGAHQLSYFLSANPSFEEINDWLLDYRNNIEQLLGTSGLDIYSVINNQVILPLYDLKSFDYSSKDWYNNALKANGKIVYSDIYIDHITSEYVLTLSMKIGDNNVFAMDIYPEKLTNKWISLEDLPEDSSYFLIDRKGYIIFTASKYQDKNIDIDKTVNSILDHLSNLHADSNSYYTILELENGEKMGVYYNASKNGLVTVVTIPYYTLLKDFKGILRDYILAVPIILVLFLILYIKTYKANKKVAYINQSLSVLSKSFYAIYRVNYDKNTYTVIKESEFINKGLDTEGNYNKFITGIASLITDEDRDIFKDSFSTEGISKISSLDNKLFSIDVHFQIENKTFLTNISIIFDSTFNKNEVIICFKDRSEIYNSMVNNESELKEALFSLKENIEAKDLFYSSMSHDMRTPLNGISGLVEVASNYLDNPDKIKEYLDKIKFSANQLIELVNDVLQKNRKDKQDYIAIQDFHIRQEVNSCLDIFKIQAEKEKKIFNVKYKLQHNFVKGDLGRISHILNNIVSNALKYTNAGDSISISIEEIFNQDYNYQFVIEDTGIGMSKEFLDKIYEPFSREASVVENNIDGFGLGMGITLNRVQSLDGKMFIESELYEGTKVTVQLPLIVNEHQKQKNNDQQQTNIEFINKRVLVADDNVVNMEIMNELLSLKNIEVIKAYNGKEAIDIFSESEVYSFDAVLLDIQMPDMDGYETAKAIRSLMREDAKKVSIIAITSNVFQAEIDEAYSAGMNEYIKKPIDVEELYKKLKKLIG